MDLSSFVFSGMVSLIFLLSCRAELASGEDCEPTHFRCADGTCIYKSWKCDQDLDCLDASDEVDCDNISCSALQFSCGSRCIPLSWRCDGGVDCYPNGEDEKGCTETTTCSSKQFQCADKSRCIPTTWQCDGKAECSDGSDEINCENHTCASHDFSCANGKTCIKMEWVCDFDDDCGDRSDEAGCPTKPCRDDQFRCGNGRCVSNHWVCDKQNDCKDFSDELNCTQSECDAATEFRCSDGRCININWKCDGEADCDDKSDEQACGPVSCSPGEWQCVGTTHCLKMTQVCDGNNDCGDNSDEGTHCLNRDCLRQRNCSHSLCRDTPKGPECYCKPGYVLDSDGISCNDIDECLTVGICDHDCVNTNGSYKCLCAEGYVFEPPQTCRPQGGDEPWLLLANIKSIRLVSLNGKVYSYIFSNLSRTIALDFDFSDQKLYWTDVGENAIHSTHLQFDDSGALPGKVKTVVQDGLAVADGLAVDWVAKNLYFVDSSAKRIFVCQSGGSYVLSLITKDLLYPRGIAVDPRDGYLFWTDWGMHKIERAGMDGSNRKTILNTHVYWPNALTLDYPTRQIYWADANFDYIASMSYDGGERRRILGHPAVVHPFAITVFRNHLHFSDWTRHAVVKVNKFSGNVSGVLLQDLSQPMDIQVYHSARQPLASNPCNNTSKCGCSHLCLITPIPTRGCACRCMIGYKLAEDRKSCTKLDTFLIYTRGTEIVGIPKEVNSSDDAILPLFGLGNARGLDYDAKTNMIYFSDITRDNISRFSLSDRKMKVLVKSVKNADGIAVDWLGRNLYWTDADRREVAVAMLNGSFKKVLFNKGVARPRAIVLHPVKGKMYWSDWNSPAKIEVANMDGTDRHIFVQGGGLTWPNGLSIDYNAGKLYWADARTDVIEWVDLNGLNRSVLLGRLNHPFGLDVHNGFIYWTDWTSKDIKRASISDPTSVVVMRSQLEGLMEIRFYDPERQNGDSPCDSSCSHLCLLRPAGFTCGCPDGMDFERGSNSTCIGNLLVTPTPRCPSNQFACSNGDCIPKNWKCDKEFDCTDHSDETMFAGCAGVSCDPKQFQCVRSGKCIAEGWYCDGDNDCADRSDESNCTSASCTDSQFQCSDGKCISSGWRCDGFSDCADGIDELHCVNQTCPHQDFTCTSGRCVPLDWLCDGDNDCGDGSDEHGCPVKQCSEDEFRCNNGECITGSWRCDGRGDCDDDSDEDGCATTLPSGCGPDKFLCNNSRCIPSLFLCDLDNDCGDNSDEHSNCTQATCPPDQFTCHNQQECILAEWKCDGDNDCGDKSDELNCSVIVPTCSPRERQCLNSSVCIEDSKFCDGKKDCPDGSDEGIGCAIMACNAHNGGCSQLCNALPEGTVCSCYKGFSLASDNKTCDDINECEEPGACSQQCFNRKGSFICKCVEGYKLEYGGKHCKAAASITPFLFFSTKTEIRKVDLRHGFNYSVVIRGLQTTIGIDFHWAKQQLYYSDVSTDKIRRCFLNGRKCEDVITTGLLKTEGLAVDWIGGNLYWTDMQTDLIEVSDLDGRWRMALISDNLTSPRGLALDPRDGLLFWSDWGSPPRIERAHMDGSSRQVLVTTNIAWPNGITLDFPNRRLYWIDARLDYIAFCDYNGSNRHPVLRDKKKILHPFSITLFEDMLFWSDWAGGGLKIKQGNKFHGGNHSLIHFDGYRPIDVHVVHPLQQPKGVNYCENSTCSHLCLLKPQGFSCQCPVGMQLMKDNRTCEEIRAFLLYAKKTVVSAVSLDPRNTGDQIIPVRQLKTAVGVDFSYEDQYVYWSEITADKISRQFLNGSGYETVVSDGLSKPEGISYDWTAKNIYWTDSDKKVIAVARHDGSYQKVLISSKVAKPRAIIVHPLIGLLFWSDWEDGHPRIERALMDGSNRIRIKTSDLKFPNGLAIDFSSQLLYWCDGGTDKIGSMSFDGSSHEIHFRSSHPFAVSVFKNALYWSDWTKKAIFKAPLNGKKMVLKQDKEVHYGVRVFSEENQPGISGCSVENGNCSQLCFPMGSMHVKCSCAMGYELAADGKTCNSAETFLVYSTASEIRGISLNPGSKAEVMQTLGVPRNCFAVDFYFNSSLLFFADDRSNTISQVSRVGTDSKAIINSGLRRPQGLAVDWVAGNIFWTDTGNDVIEVSRIDGRYRTVVISTELYDPRGIAVYPAKGLMFWTDHGRGRRSGIQRAAMDGSNRRTLAQGMNVKGPVGITLDYTEDKVYWVDEYLRTMWKMDLDGGSLEPVISATLQVPYGITLFDRFVYWTDWGNMSVLRADKYNGTGVKVLTTGVSLLRDLRVFSPQRQPQGGPCVGNGGCEELCLAVSTSQRRCVCVSGQTAADGKSCVDPAGFLMVSGNKKIGFFPLNPLSQPPPSFSTITRRVGSVVGLEADFESKVIYFADTRGRRGAIKAVYLNGAGMRVVVGGLKNPLSLALDFITKELYWTDFQTKTIEKAHVTGTNQQTFLRGTRTVYPNQLVVIACQRLIAWTEGSTKHVPVALKTANTDGSDVKMLVNTSEDGYSGSFALAYDYLQNRLYWSAPGRVESILLNGTGRHVVMSSRRVSTLTIFGNFLYWVDELGASVKRADKVIGANTQLSAVGYQVSALQVFAKERQNCTVSPCLNGGGCSHFCEVHAQKRVCTCPSGLALKDGFLCVNKSVVCSELQFACLNGKCVLDMDVCDKENDCGDNSDESSALCVQRQCRTNEFRCTSGQCIRSSWKCDFERDCTDGSDEKGCPQKTCATHRFTCANGHCIDIEWKCDGDNDCGDFSDETDCPPVTCPPGKAKCGDSNKCINSEWLCDGDYDCSNKWDESEAVCNRTCSAGSFRCASGYCISMHWRCDGKDDCGDGSDEHLCAYHSQTCLGNHFTCRNSRCISRKFVCDGDDDCGDGSDEATADLHCSERTCDPTEFKCVNTSRCVLMSSVCDGYNDCGDASDEHPREGCVSRTCKSMQFRCANGLCVQKAWLCDGENDCGDSSDESSCVNYTCNANQFICKNGYCVPRSYVCDAFRDCSDGSDEDPVLCSRTPTPSCPRGYFNCGNGRCLNSSLVCNGHEDCINGADELGCKRNACSRPDGNKCSQLCNSTRTGYTCSCRHGFKLLSDGASCEDINECEQYELNKCNHYCVNLKGHYKCNCAEGYKLQPGDVHTCKPINSTIQPFLTFLLRYEVRKLAIDGSREGSILRKIQNSVAIDFDWSEKRLYWTEGLRPSRVMRAFFNGTGVEVVLESGLSIVEGLAVDWVGRNLYLADRIQDKIFVSTLDGRYIKSLISDGLQEPRAVIVDPSDGFFYYSDWGSKPHIGKCGLDGSGRHWFITSKSVGWPNGLTLCQITKRLFWVDAKLDTIESCDRNGQNRIQLTKLYAPHPFSISVFEDFVYWTDWLTKAIHRAHRRTGLQHSVLLNSSHRLMGLQVVHPFRQPPLPSPCANSSCSRLCLLTPQGGYRCACPDNYHLANDGKTCLDNCTNSEFLCANNLCIPRVWRCDGDDDCGDGSDEPSSCSPRHCQPGMFQCDNTTCVSIIQVCNDHKDCVNGADETSCASRQCAPFQFRCANKRCVFLAQVCNGKNDCGDNSDELPCKPFTCSGDQYTCPNGRCISRQWLCDGGNDCGDESDESLSVCHNQTCDPVTRFQCNASRKCIPKRWTCDGDGDCDDRSDEDLEVCKEHQCGSGMFQCQNKRCIPQDWRCDSEDNCNDGSDEAECVTLNCTSTEFRCRSGRCISSNWVCDGNNDCGDLTDEQDCVKSSCRLSQFRCTNGDCIPKEWNCDGNIDCQDASDEQGCPTRPPYQRYCPKKTFPCNNTMCVHKAWVCDGEDDCGDGSDEAAKLCGAHSCLHTQFRCPNNVCIPKWQHCDGVDDCGDGSDELTCAVVTTGCNSTQFKCINRNCISNAFVCDSKDDCGDASDEKSCDARNTSCSVNNGGCEQNCTIIDGTVLCTCWHGFLMAADTQKCMDIDECKIFGTCSQHCVNTRGSYKCQCDQGYIKAGVDGKHCKAKGKPPSLLFPSGGDIRHLGLDSNVTGPYNTMAYDQGSLGALTVWWEEKLVYWTDLRKRTIKRAKMSDRVKSNNRVPRSIKQEIQDLQVAVGRAQGLAVDWLSGNIYWTDVEKRTIEVANKDGHYRYTLMSGLVNMPHALVLDPPNRRIYWSELGYRPAIQVAQMDGTNGRVLVKEKLKWPLGLALDAPARRLYWCDYKLRLVDSVGLDGRDRQPIRKLERGIAPTAVALHENYLYITAQSGMLYRLNKFGQGPLTVLVQGLRRPLALVVYQQQQQQVSKDAVNYCGLGKNKCSHLCLPGLNKPICKCPTGDSGKSGANCRSPTKSPRPLPVCWIGLCGKGTCVNVNNKATCLCPRGFRGKRCETTLPTAFVPSKKPVCFLKCLNGGTCVIEDGKPKCKPEDRGQYHGRSWASGTRPKSDCNSSVPLSGPTSSSGRGRCLPRTMGELCDMTCALFSCSHGGTCIIQDGQFACQCRRGFRYVGNKTCVLDKCYDENRNGKLCGNLECVVTNDTNEAMCRCPDRSLAKFCKEPEVLGRNGTEVMPQIIVPVVMGLLLLIAIAILVYCRRRGPMKKAQYSGMTTVQVGNPSFLYEEMLEDYEDSSVNPDFNWEQDEKATTFSNPVYESVYRSDASMGSEVLREREPPRVEFRRSKADFSNPVYEALLMQNGSQKSGSVLWRSNESINGDTPGNQDTDC